MSIKKVAIISLFFFLILAVLHAQQGLVPEFKIEPNDMALQRLAHPGTPFNKAGRKFAILADESGSFEAWAYPLKLLRSFEFSFLTSGSTRLIHGRDIVRYITVSPEATTLTFTYQSFTVKAIFITPVEEAGAIILLNGDSTEPLTIVCGFLPVLQPMWPAGIGGQYAYWDDKLKAYIISESTGKNHGIIGSPAASGISYTPAHMLSDTPSEFKIEIQDPLKVKNSYIPIIIAGGKGPQEKVLKVYENLKTNPEKSYRKNLEYYRDLRKNTLRVQTPSAELNLAFSWAKVTFDNLMVENPDLGKGLVAGLGASGTSGRPGFGWFFGGDAYINSFSLLSYGVYPFVRDALAFTQKWQRKDGKMPHELSQAAGYIDWWNDYHYGYIHGDTTPYYIAAMYEYVKMSGDTDFIKKSWDSLKTAFEWCLATDTNNDGLMDNKKAGLGALEYGVLTWIETDIYLAAVWVRAAYVMPYLAAIAGKKSYAADSKHHYQKALNTFNEKFWDKDNQFYAYAFNAKGEHVKEISPWNSIGLMWNFGTEERSLKSLERISSSELTTDWGIRSISVNSKHFQPLNYNYGAVWPFLTSWVTTALYKHHMPLQAYSLLMSTARHTFDNALGCITEVFSGTHNVWPQEAVSQQGFSSAGAVLPFVRGLLGLEGNALERSVSFTPHFPACWDHVSIDNFKIGKAAFSFDYRRDKNKIKVFVKARDAGEYRLWFAPALGAGTHIQFLVVDGHPFDFKCSEAAQVVQPFLNVPVNKDSLQIEISFLPAFEIFPLLPESKVGDRNKGLKIISFHRKGSKIELIVEGLAGNTYQLGTVNPETVESLEGAEISKGNLRFVIPQGKNSEFVSHKVIIQVKQ